MRTRLRFLGASVAVSLATAVVVPLLSSADAQAAGFTGGNLVVYRVGNGSAPLDNAATRVFLDEYAPNGTLVQSVPLRTTAADGNQPLTASGQSRSEGLIARSADGRFVTLTGYAAAPGTTGPGGASLTASDPASVARVVGIADANAVVDTSTKLPGASAPQIIRSAVTTSGDRIWAAGGDGGVLTTTLGAGGASVVAGDAASNLNALTVQDGQLFTSGILADRLAGVGTGTPSGGASLADLNGLPDNLLTYGYAFLDLTPAGFSGTTLDTVYVANASSRGGTVDKYRWNGTTWTGVGFVDVEGAFGLVAAKGAGTTVSIAVTTPSKLLLLTDPNGAAGSFGAGAPTTLASATANTEFRGVALAPQAAPGPSVYVRKPSTGSTVDLSAGPVSVSAYVDSPNGVSAVAARVGTGDWVAATKGAGNVWTAKIPAGSLAAGAATLSVRATDQAGTPATRTVTRKITLSGSSTPPGTLGAGRYDWKNHLVTRTGTWTSYTTTASPSGKGIKSSDKGAKAATKVYGKKLVLTLGTAPSAGKVKVLVDGAATTVDLYAATKGTLAKSWSFGGAVTSHKVSVTVLGLKNVHSTGRTASLAAFKVAS